MTSASAALRAEVDRCPGVLRPHRAADGALLRLRIPGGLVSARALAIISAAAERYADGDIQLTSRANLQLRGVATDRRGAVAGALVDEIERAGLLPHPSHDRVRNIVCSPLTGVLGGLADLRPLVRELDQRLCATSDLARLPGPFLFTMDDGRGDVGTLGGDLGVQAVGADSVRIRVGDLALGRRVPLAEAVTVLLRHAEAFQQLSSPLGETGTAIWHVRELPEGGRELGIDSSSAQSIAAATPAANAATPYGVLAQGGSRSAISALVPLGVLNGPQVRALVRAADLGRGELIITPWRGVIVPDLPSLLADGIARTLADADVAIDEESPWRGITACTGAPRCAQGVGETRQLARSIARSRSAQSTPQRSDGLPVHVVGCGRRCGSPATPHVEVLSLDDRTEVRVGGDLLPVEPPQVPATLEAGVRRIRR